jgi:Chromo (CHRromatin Organisation MOdifier) domain
MYQLDLPAQWNVYNAFHGNLLLPYHETKEHGHNFAKLPPELIEGQPEWEVEEILDSRWYRCKIQYLIKWKGYSDTHNSWEPKENVNVPELLIAFMVIIQGQLGQSKRKRKVVPKEHGPIKQRNILQALSHSLIWLDIRSCT